MKLPEWFKPGLYGAVLGAGALAVVGFSWGGWQTLSEAEEMASNQSRQAVVTAMVPVCLDQSRRDTQRMRVLNTISAEPSYKQRTVLMDSGWATVPGTEDPDRALAVACLEALQAEIS